MGWFEDRFTFSETKLQFNCIICNLQMWFPKSKHGKYITCGSNCANVRLESLRRERARNCVVCNKEFFPRSNQLSAGIGRTCSQKCNYKTNTRLMSPEAQAKAKIKWKETYAASPFIKRGSQHPKWKGGYEQMYQRHKAAGMHRMACANRRAKIKNNKIPATFIKWLGSSQNWRCVVCKTKLVKYEVDHIVPLSKGGKHEKHNLQLLCVPCNRRKSSKDPIEFMNFNGFLI